MISAHRLIGITGIIVVITAMIAATRPWEANSYPFTSRMDELIFHEISSEFNKSFDFLNMTEGMAENAFRMVCESA